jgi:formylglycine-generating enzyme
MRTKRVTVLGAAALMGAFTVRQNWACPSTAVGPDAPESPAPVAARPEPPAGLDVTVAAVSPAPAPPSSPTPAPPAPAPVPPASAATSDAPVRQNPFGVVVPAASEMESMAEPLELQREKLLSHMERELTLSADQMARVRAVFAASSILSQGNPRISQHPIGRAECRAALAERPLRPGDAGCGAPHMAALADRDASSSAVACIDQFEFPNIPCEYPVVHVSAREAAQLCEAVDKRLCDAHEWEGACAGDLEPAEREYSWGKDRQTMRRLHNASRTRVWAYGSEKNHALCATTSYKTPGCPGGGFNSCGSNTFPAGSFPDCVSPFGVYDLHGNAAEHMNLPIRREQLTSSGGSGATEMKGSWFIFSRYEAHEDDCRWRAPDWHPSAVMSTHSHGNYHLGFRCCKSLPVEPAVASVSPANP